MKQTKADDGSKQITKSGLSRASLMYARRVRSIAVSGLKNECLGDEMLRFSTLRAGGGFMRLEYKVTSMTSCPCKVAAVPNSLARLDSPPVSRLGTKIANFTNKTLPVLRRR